MIKTLFLFALAIFVIVFGAANSTFAQKVTEPREQKQTTDFGKTVEERVKTSTPPSDPKFEPPPESPTETVQNNPDFFDQLTKQKPFTETPEIPTPTIDYDPKPQRQPKDQN